MQVTSSVKSSHYSKGLFPPFLIKSRGIPNGKKGALNVGAILILPASKNNFIFQLIKKNFKK